MEVAKRYKEERRGSSEAVALLSDDIEVGMKTDRIRTDITNIIFVFIFLVEFGFEYG